MSPESQDDKDGEVVGPIAKGYLEQLARDDSVAAVFVVSRELAGRVEDGELSASIAGKVFEEIGIDPPRSMGVEVEN
jgi:hypothetical protein